MVLDSYEFMKKIENRISFEDQDKAILKFSADWGKKIAPEMAESFYTYLGNDAEMNTIINAVEGRIQRLNNTFIQWFEEMFTGIDDWGKSYSERRWRIGLIHVRIGINPQHVVPAMAAVIRAVSHKLAEDSNKEELQKALSKICMIDLAFIEQAYIEVSTAAVLQETGWTETLFKRLITQSIS